MEEKVKIIIDDKGSTHIWINGRKIKHVTKIKFEVDTEKDIYPSLEIKKIFYLFKKYGLKKPCITMNDWYPGKFLKL